MPRVLNIRDYGYKVLDGAVYIGRAMPRYGLKASKRQNPFKMGAHGTREQVLEQYCQWAARRERRAGELTIKGQESGEIASQRDRIQMSTEDGISNLHDLGITRNQSSHTTE